ncbi:hypothetical protein PMG11_01336 [Penicillium brasilianum]|uniref:DUF7514 domain-containing protein n=1 Tax=Penicillium brasilianum TaxID=104259 RepID=A0A0F7TJ62_PENBI|nr:hypothetical protein PMG11_01336 [Penicillium brasilianum]
MCVVPDRPSLPGDEPRALCLYSPADRPDAPPHLSSELPGSDSDRASPRPAMASATSHWGTLINPDKSPAPRLEQLCLGIAQLMPSFDSNPTSDLTPDRLAAFYRKVGGNYDPLFLETKSQALSFIYQSLGCFHSLQPSKSPYEPPAVPSLCPNGFVRWQTIQLLMDPDEHWRFLNNAVGMWDIVDAKGETFPKSIPRDAFPSEPDPEMLQWHEGVAKRLEYDYVKRNAHRASPPNFGAYHYHFSGKDPLPDEEDYFSHPPSRPGPRRHKTHYDSDRPSRRKSHRRRLSSDDHHAPSSRRPESKFFARPDGGRSGVSSPRVQSPGAPPYTDRPPRSRGRDHPAWYSHPLSPGRDEAPSHSHPQSHSHSHTYDAEASDQSPRKDNSDALPKHRSRPNNLSPPADSRGRRHSHDAYMRKPYRDLSPVAARRSHGSGSHELRSSRSSKSRREGRSRSRPPPPPDIQFRNPVFDGPVPAPAPEPPQYTAKPPPRAVPRHRFNLEPEENRRGSYSGGSTGGSRPGSGGSSSERPRSFSSAGLYPRNSRWTSPVRSSAAKRYVPTTLAEDAAYDPPSPRRAPMYD